MALHGGGGPKVVYGAVFFRWLRGQLLMIEDYSYEGVDLCDDPELALPKGEEWDDQGKKDTTHHVFNFFKFISFLFVLLRQVEMILCRHRTSSSNWYVAS